MSNIGSELGSDTYKERVKFHRNLNKPHYNLVRHWRTPGLSLKVRFRKTYLEFALFYNGVKKIIQDIQSYGTIIREQYGRSKTRQFWQQFYLYFIIGVPWPHLLYRKYLMFKADRWEKVREFTYFNEPIERDFIVKSLPGIEEYEHKHDIFRDKVQFYNHCRKNDIPTPEVLSVLELNNQPNSSKMKISLPEKDIFIKKIDGACGVGAAKFSYLNNRYKDDKGGDYDPSGIVTFLKNGESGTNKFIVQPVLENHEDWKPFTSGALATCRILTGYSLHKREIIPISAVLRLPSGSVITDNYSLGGLVSPLDLNTGILGQAVCYQPKKGSFEFDYHPDTGKKINGSVLPHWKEMVAFTKQVHNTFDFIFVGWDITYTTRGFEVVEGNGMWGGDIHECAHNYSLSQTTYPILFDQWMKNFYNTMQKNESGSKS